MWSCGNTMKSAFKLRRTSCPSGEAGYILITLMFMVSLLAIMAAVAAPMISFQIRRDREEELVHRGVQYSRAVRRYYKKFGRYPTRLEDLESSNNLRFLRKRYKDPITGKDFKVLHFGEVRMTFAPGIAGATLAGAAALGGPNNQNLANAAIAGAMMASQQAQQNVASAASSQTSSEQGNPADASSSPDSSPAGPSSSIPNAGISSPLSAQVFGGGPIVGVVSTSAKESIREFNKKNHYKDWQFIYDPSSDRGGLLNTPAQPPLQNAAAPVQQGAPGAINGTGGMQGIQNPVPPQTPQPGSPTPPDQ
jgi:type II secretory pathway pseudopilin PulG